MSGELIRLNHGTVLQDRLCIISGVQHSEDPRLTIKNGIRIITRGFWALCNAFGGYSQYMQITTVNVFMLKAHSFCLILLLDLS